ncbi:stemmadenine O-acetyltransferase-like [Mercurialis annua]|uniref:stemmadenine O-acetyltransferase-like n=1 Tax=Mercurialis annua TaxID=3986 RepID=UPI002160D2D7|nr:stemmadenine O-acetyltransferase-like [Mercurialis annua]
MAMAAKLEIIQRETIRPSSPTPDNLKILNLSLLDQFTPITYTSLLLFYPQNDGEDVDRHEKIQKLKKSLSDTLTHFYPLAGRIRDNSSIDCNDEGAEFIEARTDCLLSEFFKNPDTKILNWFLPAAVESPEAATGNLLLVQATSFDCGGLAVGICVSHKMADASTLSTFTKCWSAVAHNASSKAVVTPPVFMGSSIFPPIDISIPRTSIDLMQKNCITKRFVFTASKITTLKAKLASETALDPTRVEAVSGLLWKTAMTALRAKLGYSRPSIWSISINMRSRFLPPLPENYSGNCVGHIAPKMTDEDRCELDLKETFRKIRKEMEGFSENYVKKLQGEGALQAICGVSKEFGELVMSNEIDFYICTSWCRFGLYDADFGWGRPVWVSSTSVRLSNVAVLMDTRDGDGIEAWLTLTEEDMNFFESDHELLEFAAVNPSVY